MRITEILEELGIEYREEGHEHCRPGWVQTDCPRCSRDWRHFRLGFNISSGYVTCWSCGGMNLAGALVELTGQPYVVVKALLEGLTTDAPPVIQESRGVLELPTGIEPMLLQHRKYLRGRNYNPLKIEEKWGVKGIGKGHKFQWRLFIPIVYRGELVSWTTRSIADRSDKRYRSAESNQEIFHHKNLLYGEDFCNHVIVLVEGPPDVWRIGPGAAAMFGTGFSRAQVKKAAKYPTRVVCFDSESAAQKKAQELCNLLRPFKGRTYNVVLEAGKDPGDSVEEAEEIRRRFLS